MRAAGFLVFVALLASPAWGQDAQLATGRVHGRAMADGSVIYDGVPYAEAPQGPLRWKAPVARHPWGGTLEATRPTPACPQADTGWNASFLANSSEDCLTVSIRTPARQGESLPVHFYIHGGSNAFAGAGDLSSDGLHREGIVVVKAQYRLGIFGFLGLDALSAESPAHASGNFALLDLIEALHWVRANIRQFGGDPDNVTISGNSAGGLNVLWLIMSPLADGLYHKAIIQAAAPGAPRTSAENAAVGDVFMGRLGLSADAAGLAALRQLPTATIIDAAQNLPVTPGTDPSFLFEQQILDGQVMSLAYDQAFARGAARGLPMLIGSNHQELGTHYSDAAVPTLLESAFPHDTGRAAELYGVVHGRIPAPDPVLGSVATQIVTDMWFRCPVNWLSAHATANGAHVWRYEFGLGKFDSGKPPEHTSEMDYIYHSVPAAADARDWPPIQRYWAEFMRTGDPNNPNLPPWPAFGDQQVYLEILPEGLRVGRGARQEICDKMFSEAPFPRSDIVPPTQ